MPQSQRAKQFAPFDALKGLQNALRQKEQEYESFVKPEISEEEQEKIMKKLCLANKDCIFKFSIYDNKHIFVKTGAVKVDFEKGEFILDKNVFLIKNILKIE